eukprot:TRINITY_DN5966_c0_g2_i3.p1 TRINITY_DN5966_c0_g2~~TRINITY_DN5966_c0_g2_i3.p1  ORF type:complete len:262 (-),score=44.50 TRINITY_DN5966_c0_g2_i3:46-831(-)
MGLRAEPDITKHTAQGSVAGHFYASCGMQGWRRNMEDAGLITDLPNGLGLAALFDGHGGEEVSMFLSRHFGDGLGDEFPDLTDEGLVGHFLAVDASIWAEEGATELAQCTHGRKSRPATFRMRLLEMTNKNPALPKPAAEGRLIGQSCGSTAVAVLFEGESNLVVANVGDSRCILSRAGKALELSKDHRLADAAEVQRVEAAGFEVVGSSPPRIAGELAVPRALGDFSYKQTPGPVSYTHLRAHETVLDLVCRLLLEKKKL